LKTARPQPDSPSLLNSLLIFFSGSGARQGYMALIDQGLISLSNFRATLILARNASPTELGVYGVGFTLLRLVRSVQEGLTIQPLNTFGAPLDETEFRRYATATSLIQLMLAFFAAAGVALSGWALTHLGNDTLGPGLFSLWTSFLWWQLQEYLRRMLYTRGHVRAAALNTALANLVRLGLMFYWVRQGTLDGTASLSAIGLGSLAALVPGLWQTRAYWSRNFSALSETWRRNWNFGVWIMGGTLANWFAVEFYPVLTAGMISFAAAGAYRALQNLVAPIHLMLRAIDTFLTPRAARAFHEQGHQALERILRLTYILSGIPILGMLALAVLFPTPLLRLLYGETYLEYSNAMVLMALFYALWYSYWPLQTALKAVRLSWPIFAANLAAILAMLTAGIWMIQHWGVNGTLAGQVLNSLIVTLILWSAWLAYRRQPKEQRSSFFSKNRTS
jgi:O-antigen/teichoic acid export membrane protein